MTDLNTLQSAVQRIDKARRYTLSLLEDVEHEVWLEKPTGAATHVAWQVGHLAMAQYALALMRVRDSQPGDRDIISRDFRRQFSKGSVPDSDPANNPSPTEIFDVFNRVHQQVLDEVPKLELGELSTPLVEPHAMFNTKLGALEFCVDHEYLHAGQIGLLRRLLGKQPLR